MDQNELISLALLIFAVLAVIALMITGLSRSGQSTGTPHDAPAGSGGPSLTASMPKATPFSADGDSLPVIRLDSSDVTRLRTVRQQQRRFRLPGKGLAMGIGLLTYGLTVLATLTPLTVGLGLTLGAGGGLIALVIAVIISIPGFFIGAGMVNIGLLRLDLAEQARLQADRDDRLRSVDLYRLLLELERLQHDLKQAAADDIPADLPRRIRLPDPIALTDTPQLIPALQNLNMGLRYSDETTMLTDQLTQLIPAIKSILQAIEEGN
ncbi:MAG: hypothetical protein Alpg2KO_14480 [Alphaproteobacteria bacterium]